MNELKVYTVELRSVTNPSNRKLYSTGPYASHPSDAFEASASARIQSLSISRKLHFWVWGGDSDGGTGELVMSNEDKVFNYLLTDQDRFDYIVRVGKASQALSSHRVLAYGRSEPAELSKRTVRLPLAAAWWRWDAVINEPFTGAAYDMIKDRSKPFAWGSINLAPTIDINGNKTDFYVCMPKLSLTNVAANGVFVSSGITSNENGFVSATALTSDILCQGFGATDPLLPNSLSEAQEIWKYIHDTALIPAPEYAYDSTVLDVLSAINGGVDYISDPTPFKGVDAMRVLGVSLGCCLNQLRNGKMAVAQFRAPSGSAFALTREHIFGGLNHNPDKAQGLSNRMLCTINYAGDNTATGSLFARESTTVTSTATLNPIYASEVTKRAPVLSCTRLPSQAQIEIDRVCGIYTVPRFRPEFKLVADWAVMGSSELGDCGSVADGFFWEAPQPAMWTGFNCNVSVNPGGSLNENILITLFL